ncbi:MAG TPA: hypothetical protein VIM84_00265 [Gemmatimonadales bacterium]
MPSDVQAGTAGTDDVRPAPHDTPVRVPELRHWHVGLLLALTIGLVILGCAVGTLAALLMSDLVSVDWRPPSDGAGLVVALWRARG